MESSIFHRLPKVELHVHLDCCLSYEAVSRLAPGISEADYRARFVAPRRCRDLAEFLASTRAGVELMQTEHQLRVVTRDFFRQLQSDNVLYAELRFAPLQHLEGSLSAEQVVEIVDDATEQAIAETGIQARIILCTLRHYTREQSLETALLARRFQGSRVTGFDIAADEAGFPIDAHVAAFDYARDHGIACTAHAGEARGPESVWETLEHFRPQRIGHGVRSVEDLTLLRHLQEERTHLELCPACNIQIGIFETYRDHPVDKLYRAGISIGINTDARTTTQVTLRDEYERLATTFGWTPRDFLVCNLAALEAAFIQEPLKDPIRERLRREYSAVEE